MTYEIFLERIPDESESLSKKAAHDKASGRGLHQACGGAAACRTLNGGGSSRHGSLPLRAGGAGSLSAGMRSALPLSGGSSPAGIFSGAALFAPMYGCAPWQDLARNAWQALSASSSGASHTIALTDFIHEPRSLVRNCRGARLQGNAPAARAAARTPA